MNEALEQWLDRCAPGTGALACAARGVDGALIGRAWAEGFTAASLENALRCVADLFQVMQHNRIAPGRVRWVYEKVLLHCERRADGTCFAMFTERGEGALDHAALDRLFAEFRDGGKTEAAAA